MPETVLALVPRVAISSPHGFGTKDHAMLVTDERMILLPWREGGAILGPLLEAGVVKARGIAKPESVLDPGRWALQAGAVVIPHRAISQIRCHRVANTYFLSIEFTSEEGPRKLSGFLVPSRAHLRKMKKEGIPPSRSAFVYAETLGTILHAVAPLAGVVDWRV